MMHVIVGIFFIALGIWGIFDEWYYVVDCAKGGGSLALVGVGILAMASGVLSKNREPTKPEGAEPEDAVDAEDVADTEA